MEKVRNYNNLQLRGESKGGDKGHKSKSFFIRFASTSKVKLFTWENLSPVAITYKNSIEKILHPNVNFPSDTI